MTRAAISDEQIETIRATFVLTGNVTAAARAANCARSTARRYVIAHTDELDEMRHEKRVATIERVIEATGNAQLVLIETMMDPSHLAKATMQELATAFGILTDKRQLLSGQATSRNEQFTSSVDPASRLTPEEIAVAKRIRDKLAEQVSV